MLTPAQLRDMTPEQRTILLDALARAYYGDEWKAALCRDFDLALRTPFNWMSQGTVPWAVLYTLSAWVHPVTGDRRIAKAAEQIIKAAEHLSQLMRDQLPDAADLIEEATRPPRA